MKNFLIPYSIFFISFSVTAHPGIGIVKDSKGNIYYTDLKQVWKISVDGKRSVVVTGVHTHELFMDEHDDLYGEHLWYNGERSDTWGHYVWCLRHTGKLDTIVKPTSGFVNDYSFVRDAAGNMYWVQRFTISKFKKKNNAGEITTIGEGKFKNVRWLFASKKGVLYFEDLADLYKFENGKFTILAKGLQERTSVFEYASLEHNLYGMWTDKHENIYVAVMGGQVVKKITANGTVSRIAYSTGEWKPCSGLFDDNDALWLLEVNTANEVRVRKIESGDLGKALPAIDNFQRKATPVFTMLLLFSLIIVLVAFIFRKGRFLFLVSRSTEPNTGI